MQRTIAYLVLVIAGATLARPAQAAAPSPVAPALAIVFHIEPPASNDPALASADVALRAPEELGEPLRALRGHASAHLAFAIDPSYLAALDRAAGGDTALATLAYGKVAPAGVRAGALLGILSRHRPLDSAVARTRSGSRYLTLATAAANELNGDRSVPFTASDFADFAGVDAQVVLAGSGSVLAPADGQSARAAVTALTAADKAIEDELKTDVRAGNVEIIATPEGEPVLPLLVDSGGKSTVNPHVVAVGARADAQWLVNDAVRSTCAFAARQGGCGFYSPFGAYDDATGAVVQSSGAGYALFSDRVVRGAGGTGTEGGIQAAHAAALHAYALTVQKGVTLPTLFWSETQSADLGTVTGSDAAMAERLRQLAADAAERARGVTQSIFVLRIESQGPWSQRPDARTTINRLIATVASGNAGASTTPGAFLRGHRPTAAAYGYPPGAESGSFDLWMGSADQASLWNALADARKAAGGDAAIARPQIRQLIVAAEAGSWYSSINAPLPGGGAADRLDAFRTLIADIYRAAGATPPANIAPVKLATPAVIASPRPAATTGP
jgi:hypothetical protein